MSYFDDNEARITGGYQGKVRRSRSVSPVQPVQQIPRIPPPQAAIWLDEAASITPEVVQKLNGPTPESYAKAGTEHAHQVALFMWAAQPATKQLYPLLSLMFAIPNGGERNKIVASRLKAEGVKTGVSDVMLPVPMGGYHGLFIEMKKPGELKSTSQAQKDFGAAMQAQGYGFVVCDDWTKARDVIIQYLTQKG